MLELCVVPGVNYSNNFFFLLETIREFKVTNYYNVIGVNIEINSFVKRSFFIFFFY